MAFAVCFIRCYNRNAGKQRVDWGAIVTNSVIAGIIGMETAIIAVTV